MSEDSTHYVSQSECLLMLIMRLFSVDLSETSLLTDVEIDQTFNAESFMKNFKNTSLLQIKCSVITKDSEKLTISKSLCM